MHNRTQSCLMVFACLVVWGLSLSRPAWAGEIVSITDEHGRKIFINAGETRAKGGLAMGAIQPVKADNAFLSRARDQRLGRADCQPPPN